MHAAAVAFAYAFVSGDLPICSLDTLSGAVHHLTSRPPRHAPILTQVLYMSAAALCAGWILIIIFNSAWVAAVLCHDASCEESCTKKKKESGAPITGAVTGEDSVQVQVRN